MLCGVLDEILESKNNSGKLGNLNKIWTSVNNNVSILIVTMKGINRGN